jgi:hypothetical protein
MAEIKQHLSDLIERPATSRCRGASCALNVARSPSNTNICHPVVTRKGSRALTSRAP